MTQRGNIQSHGGHRLPTVCPVTKVSPFFDLQKRTFSKGRIMLLQIYVTSFEEETCAGKAIA